VVELMTITVVGRSRAPVRGFLAGAGFMAWLSAVLVGRDLGLGLPWLTLVGVLFTAAGFAACVRLDIRWGRVVRVAGLVLVLGMLTAMTAASVATSGPVGPVAVWGLPVLAGAFAWLLG